MSQARKMPELAGELITAIGTPGFGRALRGTIDAVAQIDSFVVIAHHVQRTPVILYDGLRPEERDVFYDRYLKGTYLLSPFYQACMDAREPRFRLIAEIAPDDFFASEFRKVYYAPAGIVDEAGYVVPFGADGATLVSVGRVGIPDAFAEDEVSRLRDFLPLVAAAVRRHWPLGARAGEPEGAQQPAIKEHLKTAFENFGTSVLTERERDVALMMLRGHSSKSAARRLDISPDTERVHRRNIYDKLGVSSQAELCSLFFEALAEAPDAKRADPLARLLERRPAAG
jgi:DNA-binding CsgD family transcriptional regulator